MGRPRRAAIDILEVETEKFINVFFVWNNYTRNDSKKFVGHINKSTGVFHSGITYNEHQKRSKL